MKLLAMLLLTVAGFFNLFLSPFLPERTDWMVNGRYRGFFYAEQGEEKSITRFMELAEDGDTEKIREAFRPALREGIREDLLQALTDFLAQKVTGWEVDDDDCFSRRENSVVYQSLSYTLDTAEGPYCFLIRDRVPDYNGDMDSGFINLLLCPEEVYDEYVPLKEPGICLVYREAPQGADPMADLMALAEAGDEAGLRALFSRSAQERGAWSDGPALLEFLQEEVVSWESCAWLEDRGEDWGEPYVHWEHSFLLHTAGEDWRCTFRGVEEDRWPEDVGLYNITVFPHCGEDVWESDLYWEYSRRGREAPGLLLAPRV